MIFGDLQQPESYRLLPSAFQTAIAFLQQQDLAALALGRHDIDGDRIYVNVMSLTLPLRKVSRQKCMKSTLICKC